MKKAVYKNKKTGAMNDILVFDHDDFIEGNEAIPPYVKPFLNEDGSYRSIQVNKVGGYCPHLDGQDDDYWGEFIEYRYPETPYDEVLTLEEKVSKNHPGFDCGWISPEGDTYWCDPRCHLDLATTISEELFGEWRDGEKTLEKKGWIKIYHESEIEECDCGSFAPEGVFYTDGNLPTENQLKVIKKLGRFTEEFKDYMRMNKEYG